MNDDELKKLWQQQPLRDPPSTEALVSAMQNKTTQLRRTLLARDARELLACVIVGAIFGLFFFLSRAPIARLGDLIVIGSSIFIAGKLIYTRLSTPPAPPGATVVESLRAELNSVRTQSGLLGSVLWWYLLPLTIGELVFVWGDLDVTSRIALMVMIPTNLFVTLVIIAVNAFVYWLNQWARRKQLLPVEAQLESLLHSAETGEPLDEAQVASLRPMALSITAADHAKPAEFKVAFWQIALFGELGFVGIWFVGVAAWTDFNAARIFMPKYLIWIVPAFLAGLLYSWLLQKLTKRAVGISALGVHLRKGQNLVLWDEIKEVRPLKVLNIRSLWLIKESGEKTILPWTSLERHADLKAAVEAFAPANHPLRNYLSLLKPGPSKKSLIMKIFLIGIVLVSLGAIVFVRARAPETPAIKYSDPVSQTLETIRKKYDVPALAVVVTKDGQICDRAAAGVRKWGDITPVTTNDVFHIGSCTKSMTATLAAMFIEQGKLRWDTTVAEVFPEWKGKMDKRYEAVTVEQLLHHRGGVPHNPPSAAWKRAWKEVGTPVEQRREYLEAVLRAPPAVAPGTKMIYSNDGYVVVGVMLEKISGRDFESLMTEKLFKPLHMNTAGFGAPGAKGKIDQPWGHVHKLAMTLPTQADNPPVHSPCGRVHCSLDDLARYAMFHLRRGTNGLLKPETMGRLHASPEGAEIDNPMDNYACGWVRLERGWAGGTALWHNGSNTMWYIVMWLAPEKNFSVIVATNVAGDDAEKACDDAAVAMIEKWLPEK